MEIDVRRADYKAVERLRDLYRHDAHCQIVRDSLVRRGLADPYLVGSGGRVAGYGAVSNQYDPGRVTEFFILPPARRRAQHLFRAFAAACGATSIEAQTNMPWMLSILYDCAADIVESNVLFAAAVTTDLPSLLGVCRPIRESEKSSLFEHRSEPQGEWGIDVDGVVVATGGFLTHYNPPYADIFMEVEPAFRGKGYGSYLVQEVKRVCYESGYAPTARCDPTNVASRGALQRAGFAHAAGCLPGRFGPISVEPAGDTAPLRLAAGTGLPRDATARARTRSVPKRRDA